jgi:hypothetical protein
VAELTDEQRKAIREELLAAGLPPAELDRTLELLDTGQEYLALSAFGVSDPRRVSRRIRAIRDGRDPDLAAPVDASDDDLTEFARPKPRKAEPKTKSQPASRVTDAGPGGNLGASVASDTGEEFGGLGGTDYGTPTDREPGASEYARGAAMGDIGQGFLWNARMLVERKVTRPAQGDKGKAKAKPGPGGFAGKGWLGSKPGGGNVYDSPERWIKSFYGMDDDALARWQRDLYEAGLFGDDEPFWGYLDTDTLAALQGVAQEVIRQGNKMTPAEILDLHKKRLAGLPDDDPRKPGYRQRKEAEDRARELEAEARRMRVPTAVHQVTNPVDLAAAGRATSQDLMGRDLDDDEVAAAMAGYQGTELAPQQAAHAARAADIREEGPGGGQVQVTSPASPQAYAEDQLRQTHNVEIDSYQALGAINVLMRMLGIGG